MPPSYPYHRRRHAEGRSVAQVGGLADCGLCGFASIPVRGPSSRRCMWTRRASRGRWCASTGAVPRGTAPRASAGSRACGASACRESCTAGAHPHRQCTTRTRAGVGERRGGSHQCHHSVLGWFRRRRLTCGGVDTTGEPRHLPSVRAARTRVDAPPRCRGTSPGFQAAAARVAADAAGRR